MCGSALKKVSKSVVGGLLGGLIPEAPKPPRAPDGPDPAPTEVDPAVSAAREDERRRRAAAAGQRSTILTGAGGLTQSAQTGQKTLLGA